MPPCRALTPAVAGGYWELYQGVQRPPRETSHLDSIQAAPSTLLKACCRPSDRGAIVYRPVDERTCTACAPARGVTTKVATIKATAESVFVITRAFFTESSFSS